MVRIHKRASKRVGTKQREKIKKKVSEHHRKSKRLAKKDVTWKSKAKKDPGIPNSYPYKEQLLEEIESKRRTAEEAKVAEREARNAKKRKRVSGEGDEADEGEDADEKESDGDEEIAVSDGQDDVSTASATRSIAPLYQGTVASLLADESISVLLLALDARDQQSWTVPWIADAARTARKELMIVMGRADLLPVEALTCAIAENLQIFSDAPVFPVGITNAFVAGIDALADALRPILQDGDRRVAVLGLENAGRSTIASALAVILESSSMVLDTPALVSASSRSAMVALPQSADNADDLDEQSLTSIEMEELREQRAEQEAMWVLLRNQGSLQRIKDPLPLVYALFSRLNSPTDLMLGYNTPAFGAFTVKTSVDASAGNAAAAKTAQRRRQEAHKNADAFLIALARGRGRIKKHGVPDIAGAARLLLRDWSANEIGYYSARDVPSDDVDWASLCSRASRRISASATLSTVVRPRKEWRKLSTAGKKELRLEALLQHPLGLSRNSTMEFRKLRSEELLDATASHGAHSYDDGDEYLNASIEGMDEARSDDSADAGEDDARSVVRSMDEVDDQDDEEAMLSGRHEGLKSVASTGRRKKTLAQSLVAPLRGILKHRISKVDERGGCKGTAATPAKKTRLSTVVDRDRKNPPKMSNEGRTKAGQSTISDEAPGPGESYDFSQYF